MDIFSGHHLGDQTQEWKRSLEEVRSIGKINKMILDIIIGLMEEGYTL